MKHHYLKFGKFGYRKYIVDFSHNFFQIFSKITLIYILMIPYNNSRYRKYLPYRNKDVNGGMKGCMMGEKCSLNMNVVELF